MRCQYVGFVMLLGLSVSVPARAQVFDVSFTTPTPDAVVARVLSFDSNHDGRIVSTELPERMQPLVTRGDTTRDGGLDASEIRALATKPAPQIIFRDELPPARYGFIGGSPFDSRNHIDGALDDLRLAADTMRQAIEIAHRFMAGFHPNPTGDLLATMERILTPEQMNGFRRSLSARTLVVPAIQRGSATVFGATVDEAAGQVPIMTPARGVALPDLAREIEQYGLDADRQEQALAAIDQFNAHQADRLSDADRTALLQQLGGLLNGEQRDDLRAALERRPIVKQGFKIAATF